jgi:hypothetical protein
MGLELTAADVSALEKPYGGLGRKVGTVVISVQPSNS